MAKPQISRRAYPLFYRPARGLGAIFAAGGRLSIIAAQPAGYVGGSWDYLYVTPFSIYSTSKILEFNFDL